MQKDEIEIIIDYFHSSTPEYLELLGADPTRLPERAEWIEKCDREFSLSIEKRTFLPVIWETDGVPFGFSTAAKIIYGSQAYMHLHIVNPDLRRKGSGRVCVIETAKLLFTTLNIKQLFCEPNAFNAAPNRTLQSAGFKYLKTHKTVPGPINYHQTVNRWLLEQGGL